MKTRTKWAALAGAPVLALGLALLAACGGGGGDTPAKEAATATEDATADGVAGEPIVITIGNLTDLTGASAAGMDMVNKAVEDVAAYYNEQGLIPGVELRVIAYDTQFDPARDIPGYEWLISGGADVIWAGLPSAPANLKERVDEDGVCLFSPAVSHDVLTPPGHIFCVADVSERDALTLLKWISENDWDYAVKGPAKIGGAGWEDSYGPPFLGAAEAYCRAHPDQFEWVAGFLEGYKFNWSEEAEALKDCDYVVSPAMLATFLKQYRAAGGTGKALGGEPHLAFIGQLGDAGLWEEADGTLVARNSKWWNEKGTLIDLSKKLLYTYHPARADDIKEVGVGYLAVGSVYQLAEIIRHAVEQVGAENCDPAAIYNAAKSFSLEVDGLDRFAFSETNRCSSKYYRIYKLDAIREDLAPASDGWYPARDAP